MSDLAQRIRDALPPDPHEESCPRSYDAGDCHCYRAPLVSAIRAVLAEHPSVPGHEGADWRWCARCRVPTSETCPTVLAIAHALGVPVEGTHTPTQTRKD